MGDILDALEHREKRRDLGWNQEADLVDLESDLPLYWYLRGDFTPPPSSERLAEGAVIVGPVSRKEARILAARVNAEAMLPVLR